MANSRLLCRCGCKQRERRELMLITPNRLSFIDATHASKYARENGDKLRQKREADEAKQDRVRFRQRRQALNETDLKWQKTQTKRAVHQLVHLLDAKQPCTTTHALAAARIMLFLN